LLYSLASASRAFTAVLISVPLAEIYENASMSSADDVAMSSFSSRILYFPF